MCKNNGVYVDIRRCVSGRDMVHRAKKMIWRECSSTLRINEKASYRSIKRILVVSRDRRYGKNAVHC
jgi:hypothetical protein